ARRVRWNAPKASNCCGSWSTATALPARRSPQDRSESTRPRTSHASKRSLRLLALLHNHQRKRRVATGADLHELPVGLHAAYPAVDERLHDVGVAAAVAQPSHHGLAGAVERLRVELHRFADGQPD